MGKQTDPANEIQDEPIGEHQVDSRERFVLNLWPADVSAEWHLTPPRLLTGEDRNHQSKMAAILGQSAFVRVAPKAVAKVRRPSERTRRPIGQQNHLPDRRNIR